MDVAFEIALMNARAAARLAGGLGRVLLIHASAVVYPLYRPEIYGIVSMDCPLVFWRLDDPTISMIETYRAAMFVVAAEIMKQATASQSGMVMCQNRSPVLSACQALASVVMTPRMYGGHVKRSVTTSL